MDTKEVVGQLVKEPDGPLTPSQAIPTAIMFFVAMLGGFVAFYRKYKDGNARAFNFTELIGEMVVSGLCGVFAYWAFNGLGVNPWLTAAGVGIVGHMGSRALFMAEKFMQSAAERWLTVERRDTDRRDDVERRER
jgi:hypothetical protein